METNTLLALAALVAVIVTVIILYVINARKEETVVRKEYKNIWDVVDGFKEYMAELIGEDIAINASDSEFERLYARKAMLQDALKKSTYGIFSAKQVIKGQIKQFIRDNLYMSEVDAITGLDAGSYPSDHVIFEILMQHYSVRCGKSALTQLLIDYGLNQIRTIDKRKCYYVSTEDLHRVYEKENIKLSDNDKVTLLATLVYQLYRGFGILDTLRDMDIDGVNIGTSGSILNNIAGAEKTEATDSARGCWLYLHGTYIHLRFMNFGSEDELKRIITMLIRYNSKGSLTEKKGYMVNTMADKSRLLAMRPGMGEYWACWIRKFTLKNVSVATLVDKEYVKNGQLACNLLKYLMLGQMTSIVTGRQGSGKTTLMTAMIEYVDRRYNIRVIELAPELYLRELYPDRNIYSAQQTNYITASEIQAAFKKSDAAFSLVGEISDSSLAARFVEFSMTASLFSLASHHANTTRDLILTMRNSLVDSGAFSNMETAEAQVLECIKFDIHLDYTPDGKRYIARISEVVPFDKREYAKFEEEVPSREDFDNVEEFNAALKAYELRLAKHKLAVEEDYYTRRTDREDFGVNQLLHYDLATDTYVVDNPITEERMAEMLGHMEPDTAMAFEKFMISNWGIVGSADEIIDIGEEEESSLLIEEEDDEEILGRYNSESRAEIERNIEIADDVFGGLEALESRGRELSAKEEDVFGDFLSDDLDAEVESAACEIAKLYAPTRLNAVAFSDTLETEDASGEGTVE